MRFVRTAVLAGLCGAGLVGCNGLSGFENLFGGSGGTGTVQVLVTDKPFPFEFIEEATVTVKEVRLRRAEEEGAGEDPNAPADPNAASDPVDPNADPNEPAAEQENESARESAGSEAADDAESEAMDEKDEAEESEDGEAFVTVFEGEKELNLLDLRNGRTDLLADAEVPAGTYTQMRLVVTAGRVKLTDGREFNLKVPSGESSGIKLNFTFEVADGETVPLLLDVDLSRAFSAIPGGRVDAPDGIREFKFHPAYALRLITLLDAGAVSGSVVDAAGAPLAGVAVTAYREDQEVTSTASEADGAFKLAGLPPGTYRVEFSGSGLEDKSVADVVVSAGEATELGQVAMTAAAQ